jgi:hypothetical protein
MSRRNIHFTSEKYHGAAEKACAPRFSMIYLA